MSENKYIGHSNGFDFEERVKELLLFRKIVKVSGKHNLEGTLTLDNGVELIIKGNEGCGGCGNGWFFIGELNECNNAITNVSCVCEEDGCDEYVYHIFVFAENKKINALTVFGADNGYYGTGYDLYVKLPEDTI